MPRDIPYCPVHSTPFRRPPYSPGRGCPMARGLPLQSPAYPSGVSSMYPSFRNRHTHGTQHTQHSRRPQGPHRLQDYKPPTEPANREHKKTSLTEASTEKNPEEANTEKAYTGRIGKQQRPASKSAKQQNIVKVFML